MEEDTPTKSLVRVSSEISESVCLQCGNEIGNSCQKLFSSDKKLKVKLSAISR